VAGHLLDVLVPGHQHADAGDVDHRFVLEHEGVEAEGALDHLRVVEQLHGVRHQPPS